MSAAPQASSRPGKSRQAGATAQRPVVIAIDGTSASGKSTNARLVAKALGYTYVDTGAMYRTLAWYCLKKGIDVHNPRAVAAACRRWKTRLVNVDGHVRLLVDGYYPEKEIRTAEVSAAVPHVAAIPKVREWMKEKQRECVKFGNLVMEGRDIGTNVFPETEFKFYLDASLAERSRRRFAEGVQEDLASRDKRDSERAAAPLMVPLGAVVVDTSSRTPEESSAVILEEIRRRLARREEEASAGRAETASDGGKA
ncbi:MAG: (d)CMP kinase [Verrucomicrobia bacterium]|nr:MAG: (d)CMP kinase [Verrucomicrobiota bacterium]